MRPSLFALSLSLLFPALFSFCVDRRGGRACADARGGASRQAKEVACRDSLANAFGSSAPNEKKKVREKNSFFLTYLSFLTNLNTKNDKAKTRARAHLVVFLSVFSLFLLFFLILSITKKKRRSKPCACCGKKSQKKKRKKKLAFFSLLIFSFSPPKNAALFFFSS